MEKPIGIILAGGRGTRMRELTDSIPKPLLMVRGESLLTHVLQGLSPHVSKLVIVVGYLGHQIQECIGDSFAGVPIEYAIQYNPTGGTLDAFRKALKSKTVSDNTDSGCIAVSADDLHAGEAFKKLELHAAEKPESMMVVGVRLDDKERLKRFGVFSFSAEVRVTGIEEKPPEPPSMYVNCALYYFPRAFMSLAFEDIDPQPNGELYLTDPIDMWIREHGADFYEAPSWEPVGTPEDLELANAKHTPVKFF